MVGRVPRLGQRVTVHLPGEGNSFSSTVQEVAGLRVALLAPEAGQAGADLGPGDEVELVFHDERGLYRWWCRVFAREEGPVPLIWLAEPWHAQELQRRQHVRLEVSVPAVVRVAGQAGVFAGRTSDLSAGGCALVTGAPLEPGTEVELELELPERRLRAQGRILRRVEPVDEWVRYAVEFTGIDARDQEAIYAFIFHEMRQRQKKGLLRPTGGERGAQGKHGA